MKSRWGKIMLAGLAPLISLWAVGATLAATPDTTPQRQISSATLQHLFQPIVASLLILAAEHSSGTASSSGSASHAVLALQTLAATAMGGALHLLSSQHAVNLHARRHSFASLRC